MEKLMQYVWQHRLVPTTGLRTVDGRRLCILNPGLLNTGPGPDFFNAAIEIDGQHWVGNIEIHVRASDWFRHGHDHDHAYDSVILHVVDRDDTPIHRPDGQVIPQMCLPCAPDFSVSYNALVGYSQIGLPCSEIIASLPSVYITDWISALAYERVYEKADRIHSLLATFVNSWEETAYVTLARALGFGINADPFERLAKSLPLKFLRKHSDSLTAVEALLFGQAGLLPAAPSADPYVAQLQTEYQFFAHKFSLTPPQSLQWKCSGVRPTNFPYRRIALLAHIVCRFSSIMAAITEVQTADEARSLFSFDLNDYWGHHYSLGGNASERLIENSRGSINLLIINAVVPLLYTYAIELGDDEKAEAAIEMLYDIPGETNRLVHVFECAGIKARNAFTSQALIQLRRAYCEQSKCLFCRIGHRYLSSRALRFSPA